DPEQGLVRLVESIALELRLLISALGKYDVGALGPEDLWWPDGGSSDAGAPLPADPAATGAPR
ncbi:glutamate synthase, partial [Streptomyces sp. SID9727]|nr:glutamate synthase [Streptomyces sp. SID9727]